MPPRAPARPCGRWSPVSEGEEGRVGILMCAGCAFVCLLLVVSMASAGVSGASASTVFAGGNLGVDEETASARVDRALAGLSDSTCRVGDGVSVSWVSVSSGEVEVGVRAHPRVSLLPPVLRSAVVPELVRTSSARLRGVQGGH